MIYQDLHTLCTFACVEIDEVLHGYTSRIRVAPELLEKLKRLWVENKPKTEKELIASVVIGKAIARMPSEFNINNYDLKELNNELTDKLKVKYTGLRDFLIILASFAYEDVRI